MDYEKMKGESSDRACKEKARKLLGDQGSAPNRIPSKSSVEKEKMRPYKTGGSVYKTGGSVYKTGGSVYKKGGSVKKDCM